MAGYLWLVGQVHNTSESLYMSVRRLVESPSIAKIPQYNSQLYVMVTDGPYYFRLYEIYRISPNHKVLNRHWQIFFMSTV